MDEKKLFQLNIKKDKEKNESEAKDNRYFSLHTNPIIQKMFVDNLVNKKGKFSLKDLFR